MELSPTSASRQFESPEEFAIWLANNNECHDAGSNPPVDRAPSKGSLFDRMVDAISPRSAGTKSCRSTLTAEDLDSPSSMSDEVVPLYLQQASDDIEKDIISPKTNIMNRVKQREADRLGISVEELGEVLSQETQSGAGAVRVDNEEGPRERAWSTVVFADREACQLDAVDQAISATLAHRDPQEVDEMRMELFACCEAEFGLDDAEAEIWRGVWCDFDTDHDGMLARGDLQARWHEMFHQELSEKQLDAAMGSCNDSAAVAPAMSYYDFLQFVNGEEQDGLQVVCTQLDMK